MYIIAGHRTSKKIDIWAGRTTCPCCGQLSDFHLGRIISTGTAYFIPIFSATQSRFIVCDKCGWENKLSAKEYKESKKKQLLMLENNQIPVEFVRLDFHPSNLKLASQLTKVILSALLAFWGCIMLLAAFPFGIPFAVLFSLPLVISLKNYNEKKILKRAYDALPPSIKNSDY